MFVLKRFVFEPSQSDWRWELQKQHTRAFIPENTQLQLHIGPMRPRSVQCKRGLNAGRSQWRKRAVPLGTWFPGGRIERTTKTNKQTTRLELVDHHVHNIGRERNIALLHCSLNRIRISESPVPELDHFFAARAIAIDPCRASEMTKRQPNTIFNREEKPVRNTRYVRATIGHAPGSSLSTTEAVKRELNNAVVVAASAEVWGRKKEEKKHTNSTQSMNEPDQRLARDYPPCWWWQHMGATPWNRMWSKKDCSLFHQHSTSRKYEMAEYEMLFGMRTVVAMTPPVCGEAKKLGTDPFRYWAGNRFCWNENARLEGQTHN